MNRGYFVYIVECNDGSYYTGVTNNLSLRIEQHNSDRFPASYSHTRRPVSLRFSEHFGEIKQAIKFEKQVKGWSRAKKEALINNDWEEIKRLSNLKKK